MKLNPAEIGTPLWGKLVMHYEPQLVTLRARLENPATTAEVRVDLCWRIKAIKDFLALAEPEQKKGDGA